MFSMGTLQNYIKTLSLKQKWQMKQLGVDDPKKNEKANAAGAPSQNVDQTKLNGIVNKLKAGKRLSPSDLSYLRQYAPQVYQKAVKIAAEREQYRKELENCKTKEEADALHAARMAAYADEATRISRSGMSTGAKIAAFGDLQMKVASMEDEHRSFVSSTQYQKLKTKQELEDEKRAKEKAQGKDPEEEIPEEEAPEGQEEAEEPVDWAPGSQEKGWETPEAAQTAQMSEPKEPAAPAPAPSKPVSEQPSPSAVRKKAFSMRI